MRIFSLAALMVLSLIAGCETLPPVNEEIARATRDADAPHRLALLRREGEKVTGVAFTPGNSVQLLRDGAAAVPAITAAINGAKSSIDMESYVFDEKDGLGIADLLIARCAQGVVVNLIYDAWGSLHTPHEVIDRLRASGVNVIEFNPIDPKSIIGNRVDYRDHRKILVVDGKLAITGGVNISGVYLRDNSHPGAAHDPEHDAWRDTDIRVEGPAVAEYERSFMQTWTEHRGPVLPSRPLPVNDAKGDLPVQVIANTPAHKEHDIYSALLVAITLAQKSVHLTTGFFVPTHDLRRALHEAALRGVDVRVLVPRNSTSDSAVAAGRAYYEDLLEDGVHVFEYPENRVLHAKTAVIDSEWSTVGSSNLDWRSVILNNELTTVILSPAFGAQLEAMFQADTTLAQEIDPQAWARRPFGARFREWRARLFEYFL